jgi:hypothetical protein
MPVRPGRMVERLLDPALYEAGMPGVRASHDRVHSASPIPNGSNLWQNNLVDDNLEAVLQLASCQV